MKFLSDVLFLSSLIHLIQIFTVTKKQVHLYKKKKKLTNVGTSDQNSMVVNRAKAVRIFDFFVDFIN